MTDGYPCSLTQSGFVLISGRLGAVYGHQRILILGGAVMAFFSLLNGFSTRYDIFIAMRAMTGIGGGLLSPNAVAIVTTMLPPGRSRNITIGFFAASAPVGGWLGALFSGLFVQLSRWQYLSSSSRSPRSFWVHQRCPLGGALLTLLALSAALTAAIFSGLIFLMPKEQPVDKERKD